MQNENTAWNTRTLVGFDTETTGIDPTRDRLVTASIVILEKDNLTKHYWLANPEVEIPEAAQRVHGISNEKARNEGRSIKEVLTEISDLLFQHLSQENIVVAYNATYDLTLLENELKRHELPTLTERLGEIAPIIDPYMLDKVVDRYRKGKRTLESVAKHYNVWDNDAFHNAEADVLATLRVLQAIWEKYPQILNDDVKTLMQKQYEAYKNTTDFFIRLSRDKGRPYTQLIGWPVATMTLEDYLELE